LDLNPDIPGCISRDALPLSYRAMCALPPGGSRWGDFPTWEQFTHHCGNSIAQMFYRCQAIFAGFSIFTSFSQSAIAYTPLKDV
jgi:hypothetical protein